MAQVKTNKFEAEWTGKFPAPYLGQWKLKKNGKDVSQFIPTDLSVMPMYTYGEYPVWEENPYVAVQQFATDGYQMPEWIRKNLYWLQLVADEDEDYANLFLTFHSYDFRTTRFI